MASEVSPRHLGEKRSEHRNSIEQWRLTWAGPYLHIN